MVGNRTPEKSFLFHYDGFRVIYDILFPSVCHMVVSSSKSLLIKLINRLTFAVAFESTVQTIHIE